MTKAAQNDGVLRVADLSPARGTTFDLRPDQAQLKAIGEKLELLELRKLRFAGDVSPDGDSGWHLRAELGATVVQACVVTLEPVTTRIDQTVERRFLRDVPAPDTMGEEAEMPEDVTIEHLSETIDLYEIMTEALALALPDYPRSAQATLGQTDFAPPGATPLTDADTKPFASLADLKRKLEEDD